MRRPTERCGGRGQAPGTAGQTRDDADILAERDAGGKQAGADLHGSAIDAICDLMRVSRRNLFLARKLLRTGCAPLVAEVEAGRMSLNLALQIARATHDGQCLILAAIEGMATRDRARMVRLILADAEQVRNSGLTQSACGKVRR